MLRPDVYLTAKDAKELAENLINGAGVRGWKYSSFNKLNNYIAIVSRQFGESTKRLPITKEQFNKSRYF